MRWPALLLSLLLACMLVACAAPLPDVGSLAAHDVVLLGERHDDPVHQRRHAEVVRQLAARGRLAALALEMAEQGASTAGLPRDATEAQVRAALHWSDQAWPWAAYGPAVMEAVRAGVPVLGANLPRARMRGAMQDAALDGALDAAALAGQRDAVRDGHCGLLPEAQIGPMVRIQLARDRAMADTLASAARPGQTIVLLAGAGHVDPALGVPRHLPPALQVQSLAWPPSGQAPGDDPCEPLRRRFRAG